jgi:hypothetical protein
LEPKHSPFDFLPAGVDIADQQFLPATSAEPAKFAKEVPRGGR